MFREPSRDLPGPATGTPPARRDLSPLRRLLPFLRPYGLAVAGASASLVVAAGTVLGVGSGLRVLVDRGLAAGDPGFLDRALLGLLAVIVLMAGATFGRFYLVSWLGERVVADIRRAIFDHVVRLSPSFFETTRTAEVLSRLTADTTLLQSVVGSTVSVALRNLLLLMGGVVMLMLTSPKLTGLVLLVVPLVVLPIVVFGRKVRALSRESQDRIADVGVHIDETLGAIRTVQAYVQEARERERFAGRAEAAFAVAVRRIRARAWLTVAVIVLVFGAIGVILWIGGHDVLAGRISAGDLSAFVFYSVVVAGSFGAISEVMGDLQRASGATERLFELLDTNPEITAPAAAQPLPEPPLGAVAFEDVRFHYPSRPGDAALEGFSLDVRPGETVALVGPSGAGKTTVFQLLLRFYDPQAGRVLLDGVDLRRADPLAVRARLGLVPQDPMIFSASARENIRYGRPAASDAEVRRAAESANALAFLEALPQGLDTYLGEKGVRLSGGQRQRIAIARAILNDPRVLLLDEATSALDAESERLVQDALERLMRERTTLIIAHRLATILNADRIAVMEGGRIVATGTHDELVRAGGLYGRLAALQFDRAGTSAMVEPGPRRATL
ncbi:ABC transporter transmembrane domain-containing protein [Arenibaculum pallidiluteum]|uniref:ABC transporter transmembrane domain-containing protein n=1 Tax=Arenibaculum pallidiluteum TaxID=2812559 RepID=UPI002E2867C3|nr:ABC transporter transmembrane domain-containing protein [Arenibaculum pallidiluteum]